MSTGDVWVLAPLACLLSGAFAVYLVGRLITSENRVLAFLTSAVFAAALVAIGILTLQSAAPSIDGLSAPLLWGSADPAGTALGADRGGLFVGGIATALGLCVAVYSGRYLSLDRRYATYYPLLLLMVAGLLGMVMSTDLFGVYMFCELMGVTAYALVAFRRRTDTAVEAGFKYLVMGSVGTLTFLMGLGLIYRETGSLAIGQALVAPQGWARAGLACMVVGLGIKSAIVPAHTWLPDAHGRAPSSVSAMLSGVVIQSTLYVLLKIALGMGYPPQRLGLLLILLSMVNMTVGNALALVQEHTKRLLAYSTIAQMGYVLFSLGVGLRYDLPAAVQAGFFLVAAHAAMKALAFLSKGVCHFYVRTTLIDELRGTYQRLPLAAVTFALALIGLAGVPPLAGFAGKWFLLAGAFSAQDWPVYAGMAILLINTVLSLGYYLPVIGLLFSPLPTGSDASVIPISRWMAVPLIVLGLLVLAMGLAPGAWLRWSATVLSY